VSTENVTEVIYAKLVRGRVYFLGNREFMFGEEQEISAEDREWLEVHAVDEVTVEGEGEHQKRQKFQFSVRPRDEKAVAKSPSPRTRTR
jgi:hypothetical protein